MVSQPLKMARVRYIASVRGQKKNLYRFRKNWVNKIIILCKQRDIATHELGHAIGLQHEQTRPDRDEWVTIHEDNIWDGTEHNFQKYSDDEVQDHDIFYDYRSIMHYSQMV